MWQRLALLETSGMLILSAMVSCSSSASDEQEAQLVTSREDLCAGAAPVYEDHGERYATAIACPFVQHTENIAKYGEALPQATALYDRTGILVANVTHTCDRYTLGTDPQGVTVVIDRVDGRLFSHGTVHPGQELSSLSSPVDVPVDIHRSQP